MINLMQLFAVYYLVLFFVFITGLVFGSFANVLIYRLPRGLSPVAPSSFCPVCGEAISFYDNIPLLSYILLGGKCRRCSSRISIRYLLVELFSGFSFAAPVFFFGFTAQAFQIIVLLYFFIIITPIDLKYALIPDEINLALFFFGVLIPKSGAPYLRTAFFSVLSALIAGLVLFMIAAAAAKIFGEEAMGMGDVKLIAALAATTGMSSIFWLIFISSVLGSVVGITVKIIKKSKGYTRIAFGPYLCLAALIYTIFASKLPPLL